MIMFLIEINYWAIF